EFIEETHWSTYPTGVQDAFNEYFKYYAQYQSQKLSSEKVEISIRISVPDINDTVYITGNQDALANWNPGQLQMKKVSDFEREIKVKIQLPAEFKFTRGDWATEALVEGCEFFGNIAILPEAKEKISMK